jgi:hypothetical protein
MDIPLIGYYPIDEQPDSGVLPDIPVVASLDQIARGEDAVLAATRQLIASELSPE